MTYFISFPFSLTHVYEGDYKSEVDFEASVLHEVRGCRNYRSVLEHGDGRGQNWPNAEKVDGHIDTVVVVRRIKAEILLQVIHCLHLIKSLLLRKYPLKRLQNDFSDFHLSLTGFDNAESVSVICLE